MRRAAILASNIARLYGKLETSKKSEERFRKKGLAFLAEATAERRSSSLATAPRIEGGCSAGGASSENHLKSGCISNASWEMAVEKDVTTFDTAISNDSIVIFAKAHKYSGILERDQN